MKFPERLKELRTEKNLTQTQLANIFNVDQTSIKNWENGINETDFKTLLKLAEFFDVSTDYLLGKENELRVGS